MLLEPKSIHLDITGVLITLHVLKCPRSRTALTCALTSGLTVNMGPTAQLALKCACTVGMWAIPLSVQDSREWEWEWD